jgi:hypothetical protein
MKNARSTVRGLATREARARRGRAGFTLVELMVSLVAGLIVTIAVVGLARAATTTFFEAARISAVESTVRTASERLRQDLARAGYMSTGNIRLARDGAPGVPLAHRIAVSNPSVVGGFGGSRYTGLNDLQGVRIIVGGSGNNPIPLAGSNTAPNALSTSNGLNPDAAILGGNYTSDDSYQGTFTTAGGACPGGHMVVLNTAADAAVRRLTSAAVPLSGLQAAFTPVPLRKFAARVIDGRGCQHYVLVCNVAITATGATVSLEQDTAAGPAVLPTTVTNCGARDGEPVTINPIQRVRWYIGPNVDAGLDPAAGGEIAANKHNIYRDFLDAADPPTPILEMRQIVAEFAADLKFGVTVADAANVQQIFEMDTDPGGGAGTIDTWTQAASGTAAGGPGPQRVRSVRFRIATRAAVPDRNTPILPSGAPYLTRYCVDGQPVASCRNFARVRTVVSEVALMNQLGMTY